jgi:tetratricopeptide (TPR) repeat protein
MKFTLVLVTSTILASAGFAETPLEMANRGARLYSAANYPEAESLYRRALAAWPQGQSGAYGRAILLNNLGELLRITGRYTEAELTINQAFETASALGAQAQGEAGKALDNLAVIYRTQGNLEKAESFALRAAPMVNGSEKPASHLVLATVYIEQRRFNDAEPLLQELAASNDQRTALTADIILATAALGQDNFSQGEAYARKALELAERTLAPNHPAIAMALNDLAQACRSQGQYLEAEKRYREAIAVWESSVGPNHPDLAKGLLGLAGLYRERERYAGAETLYRRALGILQHAYGDGAPQVLSARTELAELLRAEKRFTEASKIAPAVR